MASLGVTYSDLETAIRDFVGDPTAVADVDIQRGYRLFLAPPIVGESQQRHRWSFLSPIGTLDLWPTTTGTIATAVYDGPTAKTTLTVATAAFYSSMRTHPIVIADVGTFYITDYDSTTQIKVLGDASAAHATDKTFTITSTGRFPLPETYGSIEGPFVFPDGSGVVPLHLTGWGNIRILRSYSNLTSTPRQCAIVPRPTISTIYVLQKHAARWDLEVWPKTNAWWLLTFRYRVSLERLHTTDFPYPLGGEEHGETILQACVAAAELRLSGKEGDQWKRFLELLAGSIAFDCEAHSPRDLGYCWDFSDQTSAPADPRAGVEVHYTPRGS